VHSLAWPGAVVLLVLILRRPIASLIPHLRRMKYRNLELDFDKKLEELEAGVKEAKLPAPAPEAVPALPQPWPTTFREYIERLAGLSPRAAVMEAWRFVEAALRDATQSAGPAVLRSPRAMQEYVISKTDLDPQTVALIDDLRVLRNEAAHASEFSISPEQACEFGDLAVVLASALYRLRPPTE